MIDDLSLPSAESLLDAADLRHGVINALRTGIRFADAVTTVSPTYAQEICHAPVGMGMETTLRTRTDPVIGILNGVDYRDWDPRHDPQLTAHYSVDDLSGKSANKQQLLAATGSASRRTARSSAW